MSRYTTRYKTENGKTFKVRGNTPKQTEKDGARESPFGADNKNSRNDNPAKQGASNE